MRCLSLVILLAVISAPLRAQEPPKEKPLTLDELLADYRYFGLPLPPKDAPLVRYAAGNYALVNGLYQDTAFSVAFVVKPATKDERAAILRGTSQYQPSWKLEATPISANLKGLEPVSLNPDEARAIAIQCRAIGRDTLANHFFRLCSDKPEDCTRRSLCESAWNYWKREFGNSDKDRKMIADRLKMVFFLEPTLQTDDRRAFLHSLELALVPGRAKPGSIEALIDGLVEMDIHSDSTPFEYWDPRQLQLLDQGFEKVPQLIEHLNDERMTRGMVPIMEVVSDLLKQLSCEALVGDRQGDESVTPNAARTWWTKAQEIGEEQYMLNHVFSAAESGTTMKPVALRLIAKKYPKHLPDLHRKAIGMDNLHASPDFMQAITDGEIPKQEKLELVTAWAGHRNLKHRYYGLAALRSLDPEQYERLLIAALSEIPDDPSEEYWASVERHSIEFAANTGSAAVWTALEKVLKRCSLGLRMEAIEDLGTVAKQVSDSQIRRRCLLEIAKYLDDAAIRDQKSSKKYGGPCAGMFYKRLEVRNLAAMALAANLGIRVEIKPARRLTSGPNCARKVRAAYEKELAPQPK